MLRLVPLLCLSAAPLAAEVPRVVTDIPPVHALVAQVMGDLGSPELVLRPGASPHHYTMRPSEARMLSEADAVVWVGPALTRWLEEPIESLAQDARVMSLMAQEGVVLLPYREGALFEAHDHDHGHGDHDDHEEAKHDDHDDHDDHAEHKDDHDDHDHAEHEEDHKGHDHATHKDDHAAEGHAEHASESIDPHVWLSPANGSFFLSQISGMLGEIDPENAATYAANAKAGQEAIAQASADITATLAAVQDPSFIVLHDAYHYFEAHFDFEASGSISAGDADTPGAQRMQRLRTALLARNVRCAFSEPGVGTKLLDTATDGQTVSYGLLDPLGMEYPLGPDLYVATLRGMAETMAACLKP